MSDPIGGRISSVRLEVDLEPDKPGVEAAVTIVLCGVPMVSIYGTRQELKHEFIQLAKQL